MVADRIADGQLDEAPLTFEDMAKIKNSFTFTLLNMLHSAGGRIQRRPAEPPERGQSLKGAVRPVERRDPPSAA